MAVFAKCGGCAPTSMKNFFPDAPDPEPMHCHGRGDRPAPPGVLGGFVCSCPCRLTPYEIWKQIEQVPETREERRQMYLDRMTEAGHIVHRDKGDTARSLSAATTHERGTPMPSELAGLDARAPGIPDTVLASYLSGQQDGQQWALIDNLNADEVREVAIAAIKLLVDANKCVALASIALDPLTERGERFRMNELARSFIAPYLITLGERFVGRST